MHRSPLRVRDILEPHIAPLWSGRAGSSLQVDWYVRQDNDANPKPGQVLLVSEVLVSCDEDIVVRLRCTKLLSVL
jgi:hypothetical protein